MDFIRPLEFSFLFYRNLESTKYKSFNFFVFLTKVKWPEMAFGLLRNDITILQYLFMSEILILPQIISKSVKPQK